MWRYATRLDAAGRAVASSLEVGKSAPPASARGLRSAVAVRSQATRDDVDRGPGTGTGAQPTLVILVSFANQAPVGSTEDMWATSYFGAGGTVNGFYQQASFGKFSLAAAPESGGVANNGVVGWLQLPYNHPDFGNDYDARETKLANDAVKAADPFVDYQAFDTNNNGVLSTTELHVVVIAAGYETSFGGEGANCGPSVWGHEGGQHQQAATADGVKVNRDGGMMFGEWMCQVSAPPGQMSSIGLQVHELGHDIGFPDLYDTDFSSSGIGDWSIMADGSYAAAPNAFPGSTPTLPDAWSKSYQGWITPQPVVGLVNGVPVPTSATSPTAYRLRDNPHGVDWKFYAPLRQGRVLPRREPRTGRLRRRPARLRPADLSRRRDGHEDQRRQHRRRTSADRRRGGQRHQPAGRLQLSRLGVRPVPGLDRQGRLHRCHRTLRRAVQRSPVRSRRARQHRLRRHDERQPLRSVGQRLVRRRDRRSAAPGARSPAATTAPPRRRASPPSPATRVGHPCGGSSRHRPPAG